VSRIPAFVPRTDSVISFAMYDDRDGEVSRANEVLFRELSKRLDAHGVTGLPRALERSRPLSEVISDPGLLLGQVCGLPFAEKHRAYVELVATPHYSAPGADGPRHRSFVVVNESGPIRGVEDLGAELRIAINSPCSNTGRSLLCDALFRVVRPERLSGAALIETGSHEQSLLAVARGEADLAAIDCVTYAQLARRYPGEHARLKLLLASRATPAPPWVTSRHTPPEVRSALFESLRAVLSDEAVAEELAPLGIARISRLSAEDYAVLPELRQRADEAFAQMRRGRDPKPDRDLYP
jgi:ABC-type phosphate/phosphonate transport system substrate-binding protein